MQNLPRYFRRSGRRGSMLAYLVLLLVMFTGIASLAVDYGHVQFVKSEMQRVADATARGYMTYYNLQGQSYANTHGPALYTSANNPVDANSGTSPTVAVTWGFWTPGTSTFSTTSGTTPAVKVTVTRTANGSNSVPLIWGSVLGFNSVDVHATAVAAQMGGQTSNYTVSSTADMYLSGMPSGTASGDGDTLLNATPYQSSIPVTPGTYVTFTGLSGTTTVSPGSLALVGAGGNSSYNVHHGESWNNAPDSPSSENGIADAVMPEDAMAGVFLTNNAPDTTTAPATVDWTQASQKNQATYSNIGVQQPFMVGTGQTTGGVTQQFLVPVGATRLFIGIWDGYQYYNNNGSLSGTTTVQHYVQLVQ